MYLTLEAQVRDRQTGSVPKTYHRGVFVQPLLQGKSFKYSEGLFVALGSQHAMHIRRTVICGLSG
jgi:hypothetical protein